MGTANLKEERNVISEIRTEADIGEQKYGLPQVATIISIISQMRKIKTQKLFKVIQRVNGRIRI